jgi:hypothetical protein
VCGSELASNVTDTRYPKGGRQVLQTQGGLAPPPVQHLASSARCMENTDQDRSEPLTKGERPAQHLATEEPGYTTIKANFVRGVALKVYYRDDSGAKHVNRLYSCAHFVYHVGILFYH